jgi:Thioesterase domains of type I polyketide synthases or non-ribosomal peptide synthetases
MAATYIEEIRTIQPSGPYLLGGVSSGGLIAFEMAQQLVSQGQEVASLALIDTYAEEPIEVAGNTDQDSADDPQQSIRKIAENMSLTEGELNELDQLDPSRQVVFLLEKGKQAGMLPAGFEVQSYAFYEIQGQALKQYRPQHYQGNITLFRVQEAIENGEQIDAGWLPIAAGGVEIEMIPGNHQNMLGDQHIVAVAERMRACIAQALAQTDLIDVI